MGEIGSVASIYMLICTFLGVVIACVSVLIQGSKFSGVVASVAAASLQFLTHNAISHRKLLTAEFLVSPQAARQTGPVH